MTKTLAQKAVAVVTALTMSGVMALPAYGQTVAELQAQIEALLAQIATLQSQLAALQGGGAGGYTCTFTRPLGPGDVGDDVKCLQQSMNALGYTVAASGPGSAGNETTFYGPLTQAAVKKWQDAVGVAYGAWGGYFGPISQAKYNSLKAAASGEEEAPAEEEEEVPVVGKCNFTDTTESIISVEYAPSPANNPVIREGEEKGAFGLRIKVRQAPACFERLQFLLGNTASRYTRQFEEAALLDPDGNELARKVLNSSTVVKDGSNYLVTFDGFHYMMEVGDHDFVVNLKAFSQIDSTYTSNDPDDLRVLANGVRAIDGAGINQYAPSGPLGTRTVDLQQGEAEQAELIISRNADYPRATRVVSDTQGEADNVTMTILDFKAKKGKVKITDFAGSLTEVTPGSSTPSTAYLYRKDGTTWKLVASATISNDAWTWSDITDEWVEKDTTNTYKIAVKFTSASSDESEWKFADLDANDVTVENELGDRVTPSESVPDGESVFVANKGPIYTFTNSSIKYTKASVAGASGTLEGSFTFKVKAEGADVWASQTGAFEVTILDDDGNSTTSAVLGSITYSQPSGSQASGQSYGISEDDEVTFTINYTALSGAIGAQDGFTIDGNDQYKLRLTKINWGTEATAPGANSDTFMDPTVWETGWVTVSD